MSHLDLKAGPGTPPSLPLPFPFPPLPLPLQPTERLSMKHGGDRGVCQAIKQGKRQKAKGKKATGKIKTSKINHMIRVQTRTDSSLHGRSGSPCRMLGLHVRLGRSTFQEKPEQQQVRKPSAYGYRMLASIFIFDTKMP